MHKKGNAAFELIKQYSLSLKEKEITKMGDH